MDVDGKVNLQCSIREMILIRKEKGNPKEQE